MPNFGSIGELSAEFNKLSAEMQLEVAVKVTKAQAEKAKVIADRVASGDLHGELKFRHWAPTLDLQIKPIAGGGHVLVPTRSGAGPWTVAEFGRHQGNASGFSGPGVSARTGKTSRTKAGALRKVSARKGKRWNGVTAGMHTATKAVRAFDAEMPKIAEDGYTKLLRRHFDVT